MKKQKDYKKRATKLIITAGVLAVILALLLILRTNVVVSEWMASVVSRAWISIASRITAIIPFSLYEMLLYVGILSLIVLIVTAIIFLCKKRFLRAACYVLVIFVVGLAIGDVYTLSAGFAYNRGDPDLPYYEAMQIKEEEKDDIISTVWFMIDDFNELAEKMNRDKDGRTISPYTHRELAERMIEEYKRLQSDYFLGYTPRAKTITSKNIMTHMHITGVFFAPFGEANVNPLTPSSDMPVTMAHEIAHSKGVMRESDANLVAYWLTLTSDDEYIRYSGYNACYYRLISIVYYFDFAEGDKMHAAISDLVNQESKADAEFWSKYTLLDDIANAFNDLYLKLQGQKSGTGSYYEPTLPPSEVEVPETGGGGGIIIQKTYNLNSVQRMMLKAIKDRMSQ